MRIVHFSDWHGKFDTFRLPSADLYVCTGDMLPNTPLITLQNIKTGKRKDKWLWDIKQLSWEWVPVGRSVVHDVEKAKQKQFIDEKWPSGKIREYFGNPKAPVLCVRGNHDFISLLPLFEGDCFEIGGMREKDGPIPQILEDNQDDVYEFMGLRFGGMRGINYIAGEWSDEFSTADLDDRIRRVPLDLDVLITHAPPKGILDYAGDNYGMPAIRQYMDRAVYSGRHLKAHLFGHVHDTGGTVEEHQWGDYICKMSNAATKMNIIEL